MVYIIKSKLLSKGASLFNVNVSDLKLIGGFSNNVFEVNSSKGTFIIKYYPSSMYERHSIASELDWITYLSESGVNVTIPIASINNKLLEVIILNNEEVCYVSAFEKAKGEFVDVFNNKEWNASLFYTWGRTLGKIHRLSKSYRPTDPKIKRKDWDSGLLFTDAILVNNLIKQKWENFIHDLNKLPKDKNGYGMIHHDLHHKNFYLFKKELVLFDFGDCEYSWFVYDIAIVLYHALQVVDDREKKDFVYKFIRPFLKGYQTEHQLQSDWLLKIRFFLNYRQIYSYIYFSTYLTNEQQKNDRTKQAIQRLKTKIENDIPVLDFHLSIL
ncbi:MULTISPECIES: phosphotransferase enzyme family protein [unclassified Virgibacillus]|uniref:phosphotransferase enzyme family protein n=1 Tax=unclassified Virgibacillus TaxID=2620237 RepID=UPI00090C2414|nr:MULTISPECIES: phosphotransferase [unclassified Virgibacillus]API92552.1 hypothetical protein BKP57_12495 [Virgibacillus sp. 6R]MBS7428031.1 phosphotransferase [Virgibacillus sp. 19R1-5]